MLYNVTCVYIVHLLYFLVILFQLQLSGTGLRDCQEWVVSTAFYKWNYDDDMIIYI